jgi:hypothetical protein
VGLSGFTVTKLGNMMIVAKLIRVELVCEKCHHIKHWGQALGVISHNGLLALRKHFRTVNKCRQEDFDRHFERSQAIWRSRSAKMWRVDWGEFEPLIKEAQAEREAWAARNPDRGVDAGIVSPGHHMPSVCPKCHARGSLQMIDQDTDQMSEGEAADYEAGVWGVSICRACGHEVDWGF